MIPKFEGCVNGVQWFKDRGQWQDGSYEPTAGQIIFFEWEGDTCRQKQYSVGSSAIYGYGIPAY